MAGNILQKDYLRKRNQTVLGNQLCDIHEPLQPLDKVTFSFLERNRLVEISSYPDEDIPEVEIVKRKISTIDAWVAYSFGRLSRKKSNFSQK